MVTPRRSHPEFRAGHHEAEPAQAPWYGVRKPHQADAQMMGLRYRSGRQGATPVTCWCERDIVMIPDQLIGDTTESCGRRRCRPPEGR